jgi:hypothetical protein
MPKLMLVGAIVSWPGLVVFGGGVDALFELLRPWHPSIVARARSTTSAFQRAGSCFIIEDLLPLPDLRIRGEKDSLSSNWRIE